MTENIIRELPKSLKRTGDLVGIQVEITLISNNEMLIRGILDSFLLDTETPLIIVDDGHRLRIINWRDISTITRNWKKGE